MNTTTSTRIQIKNILFLTDFSQPSDVALPFATAIARAFGGNIHALHVLLPEPSIYTVPEMTAEALQAESDNAWAEMKRVESQLADIPHFTSVVRDASVWQAFQHAADDIQPDLVVLGTHGRTGTQKMLWGSVTEEIFRRSHIPVLTIGPRTRPAADGAHFTCVLFTTDFSPASLAAAPYAISLAEENQARLVLLHVIPGTERQAGDPLVQGAMDRLQQLVPHAAEFWCHAESAVVTGDVPVRILEMASKSGADLIVLGARDCGRMGATTHLGGSVAHEVVAHAACPVLTVR